LLVQATLALWSALFIVQRDVFALDDIAGLHPAPHTVLAGAVILIAAGCYCSVRGRRLLKPRRLFGAH